MIQKAMTKARTTTPPTVPPTIAAVGTEAEFFEPDAVELAELLGLVAEAGAVAPLVVAAPGLYKHEAISATALTSSFQSQVPWQIHKEVDTSVASIKTCMSDSNGVWSVAQARLAPSDPLRPLRDRSVKLYTP
jgi:hypothetical protein